MNLAAAWVVPVAGRPIRRGAVRVEGERIVAVGAREQVCTAGEPVEELGDVILTPGLVNPHTHLELTCYAGRIPPCDFWTWIPQLVKLRAQPGQVERESQGVLDGAWQSLRAGVTCVGDISRRSLNWQVLKRLPLRKVCFIELISRADHSPRDPGELRAAVGEVEEDELLTVGVTPHMPLSVDEEGIRTSIQLAGELGRPWCTHWVETRAEREYLRGGSGPWPPFMSAVLAQCRVVSPRVEPFAYLERCAAGVRAGALAHCNYIEPGEAEALAAAGHVVMYCPRAHHFFGHPTHPYRALQRAGVRVAIGTDSVASNENLAMLEELRHLRRMTDDAPPPTKLLEMATRDAAHALRLEAAIGTLERGKLADFAAFPCPADAGDDPVAALIDAAPAAQGVWVAGERVVGRSNAGR